MKTCRSLSVGVHIAEHRLGLVAAATRRDDQTLADVARDYNCSTSLIFKVTARTRQALAPRRPGPRPAPPVHERVVLTPRRCSTPIAATCDPRAAMHEMSVTNVPIRGIQRLLPTMGAPTMDRERIVGVVD